MTLEMSNWYIDYRQRVLYLRHLSPQSGSFLPSTAWLQLHQRQ